MAIIQSILVGKGKGKIGNVVLSNLKGQTVAKQLNSAPSNPRTVAQTDNRVKMANAVLAWQFLSLFMAPAKGLRKPLESVYNAFVRTVKNSLSPNLYGTRAEAAIGALSEGLFLGNWFSIGITSYDVNEVTISLNTSGLSWSPAVRVSAILIDGASGEQSVVDLPVSELDFSKTSMIVAVPDLATVSACAAYMYESNSSKITNIAFYE